MKSRMLILSTFPIKRPQHGGQKRTRAMYDLYSQHFSEVKHCAIFYKGFYSDYYPSDISLSTESDPLVIASPLTSDIVSGEAIINDKTVRKRISKFLMDFKPEIMQLEQPFLYLGLKPLLEELKLKPLIVYDSQNIEAPMKKDILEGVKAPDYIIEHHISKIENIERVLVKDSSIVAACTQKDLNWYKKIGAKRLVLAPNGIKPIGYKHLSIEKWDNIFKSKGIKKKAVFIGSAHPPNWTGFLSMIGKGLGFLDNQSRIVLAGSICDYFEREIKDTAMDIQDVTFWLRAYSAGRLTEDDLCAIIYLSDVILLPITEGGGSNLKTAEAIIADKKVVSTGHGLRSFEWYREFPNLWVANTAVEFRESINQALEANFVKRNESQHKYVNKVTWDFCLNDLLKEVKSL